MVAPGENAPGGRGHDEASSGQGESRKNLRPITSPFITTALDTYFLSHKLDPNSVVPWVYSLPFYCNAV